MVVVVEVEVVVLVVLFVKKLVFKLETGLRGLKPCFQAGFSLPNPGRKFSPPTAPAPFALTIRANKRNKN